MSKSSDVDHDAGRLNFCTACRHTHRLPRTVSESITRHVVACGECGCALLPDDDFVYGQPQ